MLGLSIQYSYKAININVMKYVSTFLSELSLFGFKQHIPEVQKMTSTMHADSFLYYMICFVSFRRNLSFDYYQNNLAWLEYYKVVSCRLYLSSSKQRIQGDACQKKKKSY